MYNKTKFKKIVLPVVFALIGAVIVNWAVLKLFGQKSAYRATHSLAGIILLIACSSVLDKRNDKLTAAGFFFLALIPCYFGTVFPDLDISLFGIGGHRNPLFHSSLSYFILFFFVGRTNNSFLKTLIAGYGIGLASHLLWDIFDYGNVRWIPGRFADRLWLAVHGILCLIPMKLET
ncbi:MAG: hypothetical protein GY749_21140 [Desulfobacteraceae bacterium]|nr:hypothetical protein [Desulfobacteraceae bacterium]